MSAEFDGLRAILGNHAAAVPAGDAPAVEAVSAKPSSAAKSADISDAPLRAEAADLSGLPDLGAQARGPNAPLLNDASSLEIDDAIFADAGARTSKPKFPRRVKKTASAADSDDGHAGAVGAPAAIAVMVFGLVLGATAAMAVFHSEVAHILAGLG